MAEWPLQINVSEKTHQELQNYKMWEGKDPLKIMESILLNPQVKKLTSESD